MNLNRINGNAHEVLGRVQMLWGRASGQRLQAEAGERRLLAGRRLAVYGKRQDEAREQLRWLRSVV